MIKMVGKKFASPKTVIDNKIANATNNLHRELIEELSAVYNEFKENYREDILKEEASRRDSLHKEIKKLADPKQDPKETLKLLKILQDLQEGNKPERILKDYDIDQQTLDYLQEMLKFTELYRNLQNSKQEIIDYL